MTLDLYGYANGDPVIIGIWMVDLSRPFINPLKPLF